MYAPVSDRRNEIWARRAPVEDIRSSAPPSQRVGSRQPSYRTEQPEEYIGYDSLRSPLVPIDQRHFAKPFSVSQKLNDLGGHGRPGARGHGLVPIDLSESISSLP